MEVKRLYFNPRPRAGGDLCHPRPAERKGDISIHAPAQGATLSVGSVEGVRKNFNPRPRAGGDLLMRCIIVGLNYFNPRPRAGGDVSLLKKEVLVRDFNPRPRAGGDSFPPGDMIGGGDFNPRPRAGGDESCSFPLYAGLISIHAPAQGATGKSQRQSLLTSFQSTPPRRGRRVQLQRRYNVK